MAMAMMLSQFLISCDRLLETPLNTTTSKWAAFCVGVRTPQSVMKCAFSFDLPVLHGTMSICSELILDRRKKKGTKKITKYCYDAKSRACHTAACGDRNC